MTPANAFAWFAQIGLIVMACAGLPRLINLHSAAAQHVFWRALLAVCLFLPIAQPRQPHEMTFVPAPVQATAGTIGPPVQPPPMTTGRPFDWSRTTAVVIAAGIVARLAWIALGLVRLRRMRQRAVDAAHGFDDLGATIGIAVPTYWSADATHPVTFGVRRPVILLPVALKAVDLAAQRAVVAHELHHVKRRDWFWTVGEEVVRSCFWFHPAMWWLISRVQLARETVVDELSILTTNSRRAYLDALLAFADDSGLDPSPAFSARRHLFHRVMLLSKEGRVSSIRIAASSGLLAVALAAGSWEAVRAFPLRGGTVVTGQFAPDAVAQAQRPPRDPRTAADYERFAQEYWEKANRDSSLTPEQKLEVVRAGIAMEDRALAIEPNYGIAQMSKSLFLRMEARLTPDAETRTKLLAQAEELRKSALANSPPPPPPPPPPPAGSRNRADMPPPPPPPPPGPVYPSAEEFERLVQTLVPARVGGAIKAPVRVHDVRPVYPPEAEAARVQGVVMVEAIIDASGVVAAARVFRSIPMLDEAALEAVRQWRFSAPLVDGVPQAVRMTVTVNFTLQ